MTPLELKLKELKAVAALTMRGNYMSHDAITEVQYKFERVFKPYMVTNLLEALEEAVNALEQISKPLGPSKFWEPSPERCKEACAGYYLRKIENIFCR